RPARSATPSIARCRPSRTASRSRSRPARSCPSRKTARPCTECVRRGHPPVPRARVARPREDRHVYLAVSAPEPGLVDIALLDADAAETARDRIREAEFPEWARIREAQHPRWVWADTKRWYPQLLAAGVRVERCVDLR